MNWEARKELYELKRKMGVELFVMRAIANQLIGLIEDNRRHLSEEDYAAEMECWKDEKEHIEIEIERLKSAVLIQ